MVVVVVVLMGLVTILNLWLAAETLHLAQQQQQQNTKNLNQVNQVPDEDELRRRYKEDRQVEEWWA